MDDSLKTYKYPFRYCNAKTLCKWHGFSLRKLESLIANNGGSVPGRYKMPGTRSYIYDPIVFHNEFLLPRLMATPINEYEAAENKKILIALTNKKKKEVINAN